MRRERSMRVSASFQEYVRERLEPVGEVSLRAMFGGIGIYSRGLFFALMDDDILYLKVDADNRPDFEALGMNAFRPFGDERSMSYYEVPAEVLEEAEELRGWVEKSLAAALRQRKPSRAIRKRKQEGRGGRTGRLTKR
jgi:DNA transformation protein